MSIKEHILNNRPYPRRMTKPGPSVDSQLETCSDVYFEEFTQGLLERVGSYTHTGSNLDPEPEGLRILKQFGRNCIVKVSVDGQMGRLERIKVENDGNARIITLDVETRQRVPVLGGGVSLQTWHSTLEWQPSETGRCDESCGYNYNNVLFVYRY